MLRYYINNWLHMQGVTIVVMAWNPSVHTLYNYLLLNLAVADLFSSIFSAVKLIVIACIDQSIGFSDLSTTLICRFFTITIYCCIVLSVLTLAAISLERYFGIIRPLVHRNNDIKPPEVFPIVRLAYCDFWTCDTLRRVNNGRNNVLLLFKF